jgi:hypothetical protein
VRSFTSRSHLRSPDPPAGSKSPTSTHFFPLGRTIGEEIARVNRFPVCEQRLSAGVAYKSDFAIKHGLSGYFESDVEEKKSKIRCAPYVRSTVVPVGDDAPDSDAVGASAAPFITSERQQKTDSGAARRVRPAPPRASCRRNGRPSADDAVLPLPPAPALCPPGDGRRARQLRYNQRVMSPRSGSF